MARNDGIDRTVARNQDLETPEDVAKIQEHNEREKDSYSNQDIVPERTTLNVHFKAPTDDYVKMFEQMEQDGVISTRGLKPDAIKYGELVFDVNSAYFYNHGGYEFAKQFYADAYKAAVEIVGGEQYILSAVMHADERNRAMSEALGEDVYHYHLHVVYIPVVEKQMISVLSAVAEIERENIRTQTMAGREQKAREGKWNGGFAPYGYKLVDGKLEIAEDEVEVVRLIYDRYIHTNDGINGVAKYLNDHGYKKKIRQNGTIPGFSSNFVKDVLDNPVYMGKIAYGRRKTEKKLGTRNEMHVVEQDEFPIYEGQHEAIISEEDWNLVQDKRKANAFRREKVIDPEHAHILSGILKCPCCGKSLYGNIAKAHSKDKKTRYYYYCKNTLGATGHKCTFRVNIEQKEMNRMVAAIISAMVNDPQFSKAIKEKIGSSVDTEDLEKQLTALQAQLRQILGIKSRLERQMDTLDINDPHFDRKILDLQRRYNEQYDKTEEIETQIDEVKSQIQSIRQEKISGDNIYQLLLAFDEVYGAATEIEQKEFMRAFIERIDLYPEKQKDGNWIRNMVFNFPVPVNGQEVKELPLESGTMLETVIRLSRVPSEYQMKLSPEPFEMIKSGRKTIELRLWDEKRQKLKTGDMIVFTNIANGEKVQATVLHLHRFHGFGELYQSLPLLKCGYTEETLHTASASDMEKYYPAAEQKKYGVVGIELSLS